MTDLASLLRAGLGALYPDDPFVASITPVDAGEGTAPLDPSARPVHGALEVRSVMMGPGRGRPWLDMGIDLPDVVLTTMRGGRFEASYPPSAFAPSSRVIMPEHPVPFSTGGALEIGVGSAAGRSSDEDMPFLVLGDLDGHRGIWVAIGWSGSWRAVLRKQHGRPTHRLTLTGTGSGLVLAPGERFETPRIFVGVHAGDGWAAMQGFLRRMAPRTRVPWTTYCTWFNVDADVDEATCLRQLDAAAGLGLEVFVLDAGWYAGVSGRDFANGPGLGTWEVDRARFPGGIETVARRARALGIIFGLWFEPERAHPESAVWRDHPEWVRGSDHTPFGLVDLGHADARAWVLGVISGAVERHGIGWLKWDYNIQRPTDHWRGDARAEAAHVRGLYAVLDELRARHPTLLIEGCASGGNRIDAEFLTRVDTFSLSDQNQSPAIVRRHLADAARLLPAQYRYAAISPQRVWGDDGLPVDVTAARSLADDWLLSAMAGPLGVFGLIADWPPAMRRRAADLVGAFKLVRHLLDRAPTVFRDDHGVPLAAWEAWEFADEGSGEAVLFAFRQRSPGDRATFEGRHRWEVTLPGGGAAMMVRGADGRVARQV